MNPRQVKNLPASILARLRNKARETNRPFGVLLQRYGMERFLYRLSMSPHGDRFTLKGGLLLLHWGGAGSRPTKDLDFLARIDNDIDSVVGVISDICAQFVEDDGLVFDLPDIRAEQIMENATYQGVRVALGARLGNAQIHIRIDLDFSDPAPVGSEVIELPTILEQPAPRIKAYSREATIAEKFEAMVKLGIINSRVKDFYDIWFLSQHFEFDGDALARAIDFAFRGRGTAVLPRPACLSEAFASDRGHQTQWHAFVRTSLVDDAPKDIAAVVDAIASFLSPIAQALSRSEDFSGTWRPPGPWT